MTPEPLNLYVSTLHESLAVLGLGYCAFMSPGAANFVIKCSHDACVPLTPRSKGSRLEVTQLVDDHLTPVMTIPINGRIVLVRCFRAQVRPVWPLGPYEFRIPRPTLSL